MFSYYGSKSKIVDYYPPPKHKKIIEPFAGSARYSLKYWENDVLLIDKYDVIIKIWQWLQMCSINDIKRLPILKQGEKLSDYITLSNEERLFMGFCIQQGGASPCNVATMYNTFYNPGRKENCIERALKKTINILPKIKHWTIIQGCYTEIPNEEATWFIDPPYQFGGNRYRYSNRNINFIELSEWCKSRTGQSIVCENTKANWMDFVQLRKNSGSKYVTTESIWSNHITNYDNEQMSLFGSSIKF